MADNEFVSKYANGLKVPQRVKDRVKYLRFDQNGQRVQESA